MMMNKLIPLAVSIFFLSPLVTLAQAGGLVPCNGPDCDTEAVVELVAFLIDFLIKALGIIAVIALMYSGFILVISGGNESAWTRAKTIFTNVIIGIIIILSAWLVVDAIMKGLTDKGLTEWTAGFSISN